MPRGFESPAPEQKALPPRKQLKALPPHEQPALPPYEQDQLPPLAEMKRLPGKRQRKRVAIVDVSSAVDEAARDRADVAMTADKAKMKGIMGFCARIWKHNWAHEFFRQKEIGKAKKEIIEKQNIHAGEDDTSASHARSMSAIVERFTSEYEETIHEGEDRKALGVMEKEGEVKSKIEDLVRRFAVGGVTEAAFMEEKVRIFSELRGVKSDVVKRGELYADNLLEIAKECRQNVEHGAAVAQLDLDLDIVVGRARTGVRTEAQFNALDRVMKKVMESRAGFLVNETTLAVTLAAATSVLGWAAKRVGYSKMAAAATFGGTALLTGALSAARENVRLKDERRQHARERAQGKEFNQEDKRRVEMETVTIKAVPATLLMQNLDQALYRVHEDGSKEEKTLDQDSFGDAMNALAEIQMRIHLSDQLQKGERNDFIAYTDITSVEKERLDLDLARAKAKATLRKAFSEGGLGTPQATSFDEYLDNLAHGHQVTIEKGAGGKEEMDKRFSRMKLKKVGWTAAKTVLIGVGIGAAFQEARAFFTDNDAIAPHEQLRHLFGGASPERHGCNWHDVTIGSNHFKVPADTNFVKNADGTYQLLRGGNVVEAHLKLNADGTLSDEAKALLAAKSFNIDAAVEQTTEVKREVVEQTAKDYIERHPDGVKHIHRTMWYDNDTAPFDKNELRLGPGGIHGTGLDAQGNYVYSMKHMLADGSSHGKYDADPMALAKGGKLRLLLSMTRNTQMTPFEVPVDVKGNVVIDPNSEIGKLFFHIEKGKLIFDGKFAEAAHVTGIKDGIEQVRIMATDGGKGIPGVIDEIDRLVVHETPITTLYPPPEDWRLAYPPFFPIRGRRPLEPMKKKEMQNKEQKHYLEIKGGDQGRTGLIAPEAYQERALTGIVENPQLDYRGNDVPLVEAYMDQQDSGYQKELAGLVGMIPPMDKHTEAAIMVPGNLSSEDMERTLHQYGRMQDVKNVEIVIFEARTPGEKEDHAALIARMQKQYKHLRFVHIRGEFDEKLSAAEMKKRLADVVLMRKLSAGIKQPLPMIMHEGAFAAMDEKLIVQMKRTFELNPHVDAIAAPWDYEPEAMKEFTLFHAAQRLRRFMETQLKGAAFQAPDLTGHNAAFTTGIYAAVGGYNERAANTADATLELGWMINAARGFTRDRVVQAPGGWVYVRPDKNEIYRELQESRSPGKKIEAFQAGKSMDFSEAEFKAEVVRIYEYFSTWKASKGGPVKDDQFNQMFANALRFLGVQARMTGTKKREQLLITDTSELTREMDRLKQPVVAKKSR
ncbi:MAG: hypothetical protein Q7R83_03060 [bacterium]|nr:hypothetical protein [bacterium]